MPSDGENGQMLCAKGFKYFSLGWAGCLRDHLAIAVSAKIMRSWQRSCESGPKALRSSSLNCPCGAVYRNPARATC